MKLPTILVLIFVLLVPCLAEGRGPFRRLSSRRQPTYTSPATTEAPVSFQENMGGGWQAMAQQRANLQAQRGRCCHPLPVTWNGYEGAGFGATPDQAIRNCCYWGRRPVLATAVAPGRGGYYATVLYR